ncbi:FMN-dependent NADH-azoreductase [Humibacter soli]
MSASPRGAGSDSNALGDAFLDSYQQANPGATIDHLDLFDGTLPAFGTLAAGAKMAIFAGGSPSAEQAREWDQAHEVFERFAEADAYLFTVPMWNSGIPYVLKQYIDIITQPGWVFGFTPDAGYTGLIEGKKAAVIYVSGVYSHGVPIQYGVDFQSTYFNDWLRFAGITDVTQIDWRPTVLTSTHEDDKATAIERATATGRAF